MNRMGLKASRATHSLGVKLGRSITSIGTKHSPQHVMMMGQGKMEDHTSGISNNDSSAIHQQRDVIKGGMKQPVKQFYGLERKPKAKKNRDDLTYC